MANVISRNGRRSIQFYDAAGDRRTLALGKVSQKQAEAVNTKVEALVAACITGHPADDEVSRWLAKLDTVMLDKLASVGLIAKRAAATLGSYLDQYVSGRIDLKPATREILAQPIRNLKAFFGPDRPLRSITAGDAERFRLFLIGEGLSPTTVHKRLQMARQFFRAACRDKLIDENPFSEVRSAAGATTDRQRFITVEETARLLEACPSLDWRVIVTLSRYGGLRCPSEVLSLTWQDVDWEAGRIRVSSPKTEHHVGKDTRVIPLFPELRTTLEEAFEAAPEGAVYVVPERFRKAAIGKHGWRNCNLRTTFLKIIRRAGLTPWDRPFHNMRASRETELVERFPVHVVTAWLGNTPEIARKHYLQVTDDHFRLAVTPFPALQPALQPALLQTAETGCSDLQTPSVIGGATDNGQSRNTSACEDLRPLSTLRAAHLSPCHERTSWGTRIRT